MAASVDRQPPKTPSLTNTLAFSSRRPSLISSMSASGLCLICVRETAVQKHRNRCRRRQRKARSAKHRQPTDARAQVPVSPHSWPCHPHVQASSLTVSYRPGYCPVRQSR